MNIENTIGTGRMKFRSFFLKVLRLAEFPIPMLRSNLFHSDIAEGKNEFLK